MKRLLSILVIGLFLLVGCDDEPMRVSVSRYRYYPAPTRHHGYSNHPAVKKYPSTVYSRHYYHRRPTIVVPHHPPVYRRHYVKPYPYHHRYTVPRCRPVPTPHRSPVFRPHGPHRGHSSHSRGRHHK